jgi:hypothetical protein
MKKTYSLLLLCLVLALSGLLTACGGGDGGTTPATTQPTSPATTQPSSPTSTQPSSTAPPQTSQGPVESPFSDIPIYPGAEAAIEDYAVIGAELGGGSSIEAYYYKVNGVSIDDIMDYYKDEMPNYGWVFIAEVALQEEMVGTSSMYMKDNYTAMIYAFEDVEGIADADLILGIMKMSS